MDRVTPLCFPLLWLIFSLCAHGVAAQFLPDINRFEVENARLVLLDNDGKRLGVLEGAKARRDDAGQVSVSDAVLTFQRAGGAMVVRAPEFLYAPRTSKFECPQGLTADLPDGGLLSVPKGSGTIEFDGAIRLNMKCQGDVTLRLGPEGSDAGLLQAWITDPDVAVRADELPTPGAAAGGTPKLALESVSITGQRGGNLRLRLAQAPAFATESGSGPALAVLSCFGDIGLHVTEQVSRARLNMLRRCRMALEETPAEGPDAVKGLRPGNDFAITSTSLEIRGDVQQAEEGTGLRYPEFDAIGNVQLASERLRGSGQKLLYRESTFEHSARLEENASLELRPQPFAPAPVPRLVFRAADYVYLSSPLSTRDDGAQAGEFQMQELSSELSGSAKVERYAGDTLEWQLRGTVVRMFSYRSGPDAEFQHRFDAYAEGYSALLRILAQEPQGEINVKAAAAFGLRAEGGFEGGRAKARIYGPEVLAVVDSDFALAHELRKALGLREPALDNETYTGRLTVRAQGLLDLDVGAESSVAASSVAASDRMAVSAQGAVVLTHESLPRDDRRLVVLSGEAVALAMEGGLLTGSRIAPAEGGVIRATLGFDLLECTGLLSDATPATSRTQLSGPGTLTVRDPDSIVYVHETLDRLPKAEGKPPALRPDAGWFRFGATMQLRSTDDSRTLDCDLPELTLVYGEFQPPRAGLGAFNDLAELTEPEVQEIYFIRADSLYAHTQGREDAAVNVIRLAGNPLVRSSQDGIRAAARTAIEMSGADRQREADAPFTLVMLDDAVVDIDRAGDFFGAYVAQGVFGYDGAWRLTGKQRLEVTQRPLAAAGVEVLPGARAHLEVADRDGTTADQRRDEVAKALSLLAGIQLPGDARLTRTEQMQPLRARDELATAARKLQRADAASLASARRHIRRALALISVVYDVAGAGGVLGEFKSADADTPAMNLAMNEALFSFNGLGEVVIATAAGPVTLSRGGYVVTGKELKRGQDGTLTLEQASISLPEDTGVEVFGVERVSLRQLSDRTESDEGEATRTLITRISGRKLGVRLNLDRAGRQAAGRE